MIIKVFNFRFFILVLICISFPAKKASSQASKQYDQWYFGPINPGVQGAGLDFRTSGDPIPLTNSAKDMSEASAMICDSNGNLLFYSNGTSIWDASHELMVNGDNGVGGDPSSSQNALIIPISRMPNKYALFGNSGFPASNNGGGVALSIVDMDRPGNGTLQFPLGEVTNAKGIPLIGNTSETIAAIRHANGYDFWVVTHIHGTDSFYSFRFTTPNDLDSPDLACFIIDTTISKVGPVDVSGSFRYLKPSPRNDKMIFKTNSGGELGMCDFDGNTGSLHNYVVLDTSGGQIDTVSGQQNITGISAISFSPMGNYVYALLGGDVDITAPTYLARYDPYHANPSSSKELVDSLFQPMGGLYLRIDMQIAPDSNLYVSGIYALGTPMIDVIKNPEASVAMVNVEANSVGLAGRDPSQSLPNLITDYLLGYDTVPGPNIIVSKDRYICPGDTTDLSASGGSGYLWSPAHLLDNPTSANPRAFPDSTTTFTVIISDATLGCGQFTERVTVFVEIDSAQPDSFLICLGDTVQLIGPSNATNYSWMPSANLNDPSAQNPLAVPDTPTLYTVDYTTCGVMYTTTNYVGIYPIPYEGISDTHFCQNQSIEIDLSHNAVDQYSWSDGSTNPVKVFSSSGIYFVTRADTNNCSTIDSFEVFVDEIPEVYAGKDTFIRPSTTIELKGEVSNADSFLWTPATTLSNPEIENPIAMPEATTSYLLTAFSLHGCSKSDTVTVEVISDLLAIPSIFSPNDDGVNDIFNFIKDNLSDLNEFSITNRWGEQVFYTTDLNTKGWDGTGKNEKPQEVGTYIYHIDARSKTGDQFLSKGVVALVR